MLQCFLNNTMQILICYNNLNENMKMESSVYLHQQDRSKHLLLPYYLRHVTWKLFIVPSFVPLAQLHNI